MHTVFPNVVMTLPSLYHHLCAFVFSWHSMKNLCSTFWVSFWQHHWTGSLACM